MDIVEKEWEARKKNGLPPYHSVDDKDTAFIYYHPLVKDKATQAFLDGDYSSMRDAWSDTSDIRSVFTDN